MQTLLENRNIATQPVPDNLQGEESRRAEIEKATATYVYRSMLSKLWGNMTSEQKRRAIDKLSQNERDQGAQEVKNRIANSLSARHSANKQAQIMRDIDNAPTLRDALNKVRPYYDNVDRVGFVSKMIQDFAERFNTTNHQLYARIHRARTFEDALEIVGDNLTEEEKRNALNAAKRELKEELKTPFQNDEEMRNVYNSIRNADTVQSAKNIANEYFTLTEKKRPDQVYENAFSFNSIGSKLEEIAPIMLENVNDQHVFEGEPSQLETLATELDAITAPDKYPTKKIYSNEIGILRHKMMWSGLNQQDVQRNVNELESVNELLRQPGVEYNMFLDEIPIVKPEDDYNGYMDEVRSIKERHIGSEANKIADEVYQKENLDNNLTEQQSIGIISFNAVPLNKRGELALIRENEITLSQNTKENIKTIFAKMDDFGMATESLVDESDVKCYAFTNLYNAISKYKKALEKEEVDNSVKYAKEVKEQYGKSKELLSLVHKYFPTDENAFYGGNMDVQRTDTLPKDIREDLAAVSHLNNLYSAYMFCKVNGIDYDEFLNSPIENIGKFYENGVGKLRDPNQSVVGKTGVEAIIDLTTDPQKVAINSDGGYGVPRIIEGLSRIEPDKDLRDHNIGAERSFMQTRVDPVQTLTNIRNCAVKDNYINSLDRFLLRGGKQVDSMAVNVPTFNLRTMKVVNPKGLDEVEYIAADNRSFAEIKAQLDKDILDYLSNENRNKDNLPDVKFIELAQRAALKRLLVGDAHKKEAAYKKLESFVKDGKTYVEKLVSDAHQRGEYTTIPDHPIGNLENAHYNRIAEFRNYVRNDQGFNGPSLRNNYIAGENSQQTLNDKKSFLKTELRYGNVTPAFYAKRMAQLESGNANAEVPAFFEADRHLTKDQFIAEKYPPNQFVVPPARRTQEYNKYLEQCKKELFMFKAKRFLRQRDYIPSDQFMTKEQMDELYPDPARVERGFFNDINQSARILAQEFNARTDEQKAQTANVAPEQRVKFLRDGEELTSDNFARYAMRYKELSERHYEPQGPNEVADALRSNELRKETFRYGYFLKELKAAMTEEQLLRFFNQLPQEDRNVVNKRRNEAFNELLGESESEYREKVRNATTAEERNAAQAKLNALREVNENIRRHVTDMAPEEAKRLADPYLSLEKKRDINYSVNGAMNSSFFSRNLPAFAIYATKILSEEKLKEIADKVNNFKYVTECDHEELGVETYKYTTKALKDQIDDLDTFGGEQLTEERKNQIKNTLDQASDFLRAAKDESGMENFFVLKNQYLESAVLHDGRNAGNLKIQQEGIDTDVLEYVTNPTTHSTVFSVREDKREAHERTENEKFRFSPNTKQALKTIFAKMEEYDYDKDGLIGEQGVKQYGLSRLATKIDNYKKAMAGDDPIEKVRAAEEMMEEKAKVTEIMNLVRSNFPVTNDNLAFPGNVDVIRTKTFPPDIRLDEPTVSQFNGIYGTLNFIKSMNITVDEYLEDPGRYIKKLYYKDNSPCIHNTIKGKSGAEALFEVSTHTQHVKGVGYGSRMLEDLNFFDIDPEVRAHNHGLEQYYNKTLCLATQMEINDRANAYGANSQLDRYFFVDEPQDDATLTGVPLYRAETMSFVEPEPFDDAAYLLNKNKTVDEFKAQIDKNILDYLLMDSRTRVELEGGTFAGRRGYSSNRFLMIAQKAALKVLLAKSAYEHEDLKALLSDGTRYVRELVESVRNDPRYSHIDQRVLPTENLKDYTHELETFDTAVAMYDLDDSAKQPDRAYNQFMRLKREQLRTIDEKLTDRLTSLAFQGYTGDTALDDVIQVLRLEREDALREIESRKNAEIARLNRAREEKTLPKNYVAARLEQIDNNNAAIFDQPLPDAFASRPMSREAFDASLENNPNFNIGDYTEADKAALYDVYLVKERGEIDAEKRRFALRGYMVANNLMPDPQPQQAAQPQPQPIAQPQPQQAAQPQQAIRQNVRGERNFTGNLFEPGQIVTKQVLLDKVMGIFNNTKSEIQGNTFEERKNAIVTQNNQAYKLQPLFLLVWSELPDEVKENAVNGLSEQQKGYIKNRIAARYGELAEYKEPAVVNAVKDLIERQKTGEITFEQFENSVSPYFTEEERNDRRLKPYNNIRYHLNVAKSDGALLADAINALPDEKIMEIAYAADRFQAPLEKSLDEVTEIRFNNEIDQVKSLAQRLGTFKGQPLDEESKNALLDKLEGLKKISGGLGKEYVDKLEERRTVIEQQAINVVRANEAKAALDEMGFETTKPADDNKISFNSIVSRPAPYSIKHNASNYDVLLDGAHHANELARMRALEVQMQPGTKEAIRTLFAKFDEYGYDQKNWQVEEGRKVYGFWRYDQARRDFVENIHQNDVVSTVKALEAADRMALEYERSKELLDFVHHNFAIDHGGAYPCNLDVARNNDMPPEFRQDIAGASTLNGLYMLYRSLKYNNIDFDEFLEHPMAKIHNTADKIATKMSADDCIKGKSGAEALFAVTKDSLNDNPDGGQSIVRSVQALTMLEKDPEMAKHNAAVDAAYTMIDGRVLGNDGQREDLYNINKVNISRYFIVKEPQEDASLMGLPTFNHKTMNFNPQPPEFDEVEYIKNNKETLKEFYDRMWSEGVKALRMVDSNVNSNLTQRDVMEAMQVAAIKYLTVREDLEKNGVLVRDDFDRNGNEYRMLKALAVGGSTFVKNKLMEDIATGKIKDMTGEQVMRLESGENKAYGTSFEQYCNRPEIRNFGANIIRTDEETNRQLAPLYRQLRTAQRMIDGNQAVDQGQVEANIAIIRSSMSQIVAQQQVRLINAFHQGLITEEYLDRRLQQFEDERADEPLPTMFEADRPLSKERYLRENFADDYDTLSRADKDMIYDRYLERIKDQKRSFLLKKYFETAGYCSKSESRTKEEQIAITNAWENHKQRMAALDQAQNPDNNVIIDNENQQIDYVDPIVDNSVDNIIVNDEPEHIIINEDKKVEPVAGGKPVVREIEERPDPEKKPEEKSEPKKHGILNEILDDEDEELINEDIIKNIVGYDNADNNIINNIINDRPAVGKPVNEIKEEPKVEEVKVEQPKVEQPKVEAPQNIIVEEPEVQYVENKIINDVIEREEVKPEEPQNIINEEPEVQYGENKILNDVIAREAPAVNFDDLPEAEMPDYRKLDPKAGIVDLYAINNDVLDRYFICKTPGEVGIDDNFDELKYMQINNESPKEFSERIWKTAVEAIKQVSSGSAKDLTAKSVANALQSASVKYLAVHMDLDPNLEGVAQLNSYAFEGTEKAIHAKLEKEAEEGKINGFTVKDARNLGMMDYSHRVRQSASKYLADNKKKGFAADYKKDEEEFNQRMLEKVARIQSLQKKLSTSLSDQEKAGIQKDLDSEQRSLDESVYNYKRITLVRMYRGYGLSEKYFNERVKQLDARDFASPLPEMFEADAPLSKQDYVARENLSEKQPEEADKAYRTYLRDIKREKEAFLARNYLRLNGIYRSNDVKIVFDDAIGERIEEEYQARRARERAYDEERARLEKEKEKELEKQKPVKIGVKDIDELYGNVNILDRYFLAGKDDKVNFDPNLDEVKWIRELNVDPEKFEARLISEGVSAIRSVNDDSPVTRAEIVASMQLAAIKYLAVHSGEEMEEQTYNNLKEIAEDAPTVVKNKILGDIRNWMIRDSEEKAVMGWDFGTSIKPRVDYDSFCERDEIKEYGQDFIEADRKFNNDLRKLPGNDEIKTSCEERKAQLFEDLQQGKITEYYYNKRAEQLDTDKRLDGISIPSMFEYDDAVDIETFAQKRGLDRINNYVETQEEYRKYNAALKTERDDFLAKLYWKEIGFDKPDYLTKRMAAVKAGLDEEEDNKNIINDPEEVKKPVEEKPVAEPVKEPVKEPEEEAPKESEEEIIRRLLREQGREDEIVAKEERIKERERRLAEKNNGIIKGRNDSVKPEDDQSEADDEEEIEPININDLAKDKNLLTRYFLAKNPKNFNADPDLDETKWIHENGEELREFFFRSWKAGLQALRDVDANKDSQLKHSDIAAAMQMAAIKYFFANRTVLNTKDEDYEQLEGLVFKGPEFIKQRILTNIDNGYIDKLDKKTVEGWDLGVNVAPEESYKDFYSRFEKEFGSKVIRADRDLNDAIDDIQSSGMNEAALSDDEDDDDLEDEKVERPKPLSEAEKKERISALVEERKVQLTDALKQGEITEYYFNKRMEQLSHPETLGDSSVPDMFEDDDPIVWHVFFEKDDLAGIERTAEEKDEIYEAYKDKIRKEKDSFIEKRYFEETGLSDKDYFNKKLGVAKIDKGSKRIAVDLSEDEKVNESVAKEADKKDERLSKTSNRRSKPVCIIIDEDQEDELDDLVKAAQEKADAAEKKGNKISVDLDDDVSAADDKQFAKIDKDVKLNKDDLKK